MTAAIGAKNSCWCPNAMSARKYAPLAATAVWTTDQPLIRSRSMPARKPRRSLKNKGPCLTEPPPHYPSANYTPSSNERPLQAWHRLARYLPAVDDVERPEEHVNGLRGG